MDIDDFLDREVGPSTNTSDSSNQTKPPLKIEVKAMSGDLSGLMQNYFSAWEQIQKDPTQWNADAEKTLAELHSQITSTLETKKQEVQQRHSRVQSLIQQGQQLVAQQKFQQALSIYESARAELEQIDACFAEERLSLNKELHALYHEIHVHLDNKQIHSAYKVIGDVENHIAMALQQLNNQNFAAAQESYKVALTHYMQLPPTMIQFALPIGEKLRGLYRNLSINAQITQLQGLLSPSRLSVHSSLVRPAPQPVTVANHMQTLASPAVIKKLITRKLKRAQSHIDKGYFIEAQKELNAIAHLDPNNAKVQALLKKIPKS